MIRLRPLMALLLICSAAFAQTQSDSATPANQTAAAKPSAALESDATQETSQFKIDHLFDPKLAGRNRNETTLNFFSDSKFAITGDPLPGDSYCLKIRSYVVARDSKDSDSVHLVGYTTCVPASRYRLRMTVERQTPER
jgi:hypothetical protein